MEIRSRLEAKCPFGFSRLSLISSFPNRTGKCKEDISIANTIELGHCGCSRGMGIAFIELKMPNSKGESILSISSTSPSVGFGEHWMTEALPTTQFAKN